MLILDLKFQVCEINLGSEILNPQMCFLGLEIQGSF